jgi:hypothetical protein
MFVCLDFSPQGTVRYVRFMVKPFCVCLSAVPDSGAFPSAADGGQRSIQQSGEPAAHSGATGATQVEEFEAVLHRAARSVAVEVGFCSL